MSAVPKTLLTPEQYLARERQAEFRSEYFRGEVFAMAGASFSHSLIKDNLAGELRERFKGQPCRVVTSDLRVKVSPTGLYCYPDAVVICDEPKFEDDRHDTLLNPLAIIEVLSDSTEAYDRGPKFGHYRQVQSIQEYVLIAQHHILVERHVRQSNGEWLSTFYNQMDQSLELASVPISVPLEEIYRGVPVPQ